LSAIASGTAAPQAPHRGIRGRSRRTRVHLTLAGWIGILVAMMVGAASIRNPRAMVFILFGCMIGAMWISAMLARHSIRRLQVRRDVPSRAWQNQTVHIGYHLRNPRRWTSCLGLSLQEEKTPDVESAMGFCTHLPRGGVFRAGARIVVRQRGRRSLRGVIVQTTFPFGLVAGRLFLREAVELVVWPAQGILKANLLRRGAVESSSAAPSASTGGQDEFFGLRDYRQDDNPRWIHWRRSASRPAPVVREMARPQPEILMLVIDTHVTASSPEAQQAVERLLRFAATLVEYAFSRGYQVGLALATDERIAVLPPEAGRAQRTRVLDGLADFSANTTRSLSDVLKALHRRHVAQAQVIVASVNDSPFAGDGLMVLRAACRQLTILEPARLADVFQDAPASAREGG
jgi:uncharacterized protein (DUF58 family)